jgi:hypothetical protein
MTVKEMMEILSKVDEDLSVKMYDELSIDSVDVTEVYETKNDVGTPYVYIGSF